MTIPAFILRTAKVLYFVPVAFAFGSAQQFMDGEQGAGWACLAVGVILCQQIWIHEQAHRESLRLRLLSQYVVQIIHNVNTAPHKAPEEQVAKDQCAAFIADPLAWNNTFLKP